MTDVIYNLGRGFGDLRIPSYWVADVALYAPRELARGFLGKESITRQNMKSIDALKESQEYATERTFFSVRVAKEYHNKNGLRYEMAESFASIPIIIDGFAYIAGNVIGSPYRFVKGFLDDRRERKSKVGEQNANESIS